MSVDEPDVMDERRCPRCGALLTTGRELCRRCHLAIPAWASSVIDRALERLAKEVAPAEGIERFDQLKAHLTGEDEPSTYRDLAAAWGVGELAVRVSIHRLRKRFGRLLREEVAATTRGWACKP
jgi:RNA polymerase subunit RPABC4/transcription elongation factor Spt4